MKIKLRLSVSERKRRRELAKLAAEIPHDAALRTALEQCDPSERNAMLLTLAPHLSFLPSEEILACAVCGAFRGALRAHECDPGADHPKPGSEAFEKMVDQIIEDRAEPLFTAARGHGMFRIREVSARMVTSQITNEMLLETMRDQMPEFTPSEIEHLVEKQ